MDNFDPVAFAFAALLAVALILLGFGIASVYHQESHFTLYYTGIPFNPTCRLVGYDLWECQHID